MNNYTLLAALLLPISIFHLWLHGLLKFWQKYPALLYVWGAGWWIGSLSMAPALQFLLPQVFLPNNFWRGIGFGLLSLGVVLVLWSLLILGPRKFFVWEVLRPRPQQKYLARGPFKILSHPAYLGYAAIAFGNVLMSGSLYTSAVCLFLCTTLPIVMHFEDTELRARIS